MPFRETIIPPPKTDMVNEAIEDQNQVFKARGPQESEEQEEQDSSSGLIQIQTPNKMCTIQIRAIPLPGEVTRKLEEHSDLIRTLVQAFATKLSDKSDNGLTLSEDMVASLQQLKASLEELFKNAGSEWTDAIDHIWAFGPRGNGPNVLLNRVPEYCRPSVWSCLEKAGKSGMVRDYDNSVINGFQLATLAGPLCEEPMMGVCFAIESWAFHEAGTEGAKGKCPSTDSDSESENEFANSKDTMSKVRKDPTSYGAFTGQIMSCVKEGCRRAFTSRPQRLMAAMYTCVIQATADVLGKHLHPMYIHFWSCVVH